ncbi:MAG: 3-carboxy-cis,cis-muconate cycloisomerase [Chloroflexi bacterium]|nr:3-carboxy-cis,cis-muconate cycloisomerase [Chloroflexota bacterium]
MNDLGAVLYSTPPMLALFSGEGHVQRMLDFEAGLARAEARAGVIPPEAAEQIAAACRVELFDVPALLRETATAGTLAIPLAKALTAKVGGEASRYVHWGATSQDVIDTALMLQIRDGLGLLIDGLLEIGASAAGLAERHRGTPMAGRTLLQQALPITFGLRAARWLTVATRQIEKLRRLQQETLALQFGGAAGTLASLGEDGALVAEILGDELRLPTPDLPWHAERDRIVEVAAGVGIVAGAVGKIAQDILLLSQTELGEVAEGSAPGKGGSSTLPHKRNPVDTVAAVAAARLALGLVPVISASLMQEHERAIGGWQSEWAALPELFGYAAGAVERVRLSLAGLEVHADRMLDNLGVTRGLLMAESLSMALAGRIGKAEAHHAVQAACQRAVRQADDLEAVALADEKIAGPLSADEIRAALDPLAYLGSTDRFINRALEAFERCRQAHTPEAAGG